MKRFERIAMKVARSVLMGRDHSNVVSLPTNDTTSSVLLCILELCLSLNEDQRDELLLLYYQQLVLGQAEDGTQFHNVTPIDLMSWIPPEDWASKIFQKSLGFEGEAHIIIDFDNIPNDPEQALATSIKQFVAKSRKVQAFSLSKELPASAVILTCIKYRSPLPPEFWRSVIFKEIT